MSTLHNARYYYTPSSCSYVFLPICLGTWALDGSRQELYCLVEVPSLYKGPEPPVTSGEAGWTAGSTHLHHTLGTSQVGAHTLIHTLTGEAWTPIALLEL